jgi:hypothetical protein
MEKAILVDPVVRGVILPNGNNLTDVGEGVVWIKLAQEEGILSVLMNRVISPHISSRLLQWPVNTNIQWM